VLTHECVRKAGAEASLLKCGRYASKSINIRILGAFSTPIGGKQGKQAKDGSAGYLTRNYVLDDPQTHLWSIVGGGSANGKGRTGNDRPYNPLTGLYI